MQSSKATVAQYAPLHIALCVAHLFIQQHGITKLYSSSDSLHPGSFPEGLVPNWLVFNLQVFTLLFLSSALSIVNVIHFFFQILSPVWQNHFEF